MGLAVRFTAPFATFLNPLSLVFVSFPSPSIPPLSPPSHSFFFRSLQNETTRAVGETVDRINREEERKERRKKREREREREREEKGKKTKVQRTLGRKAKTGPRGVSFARNVHGCGAFPRRRKSVSHDLRRYLLPLFKTNPSHDVARFPEEDTPECVLGRLRAICPTDLHALRAEIRPTRADLSLRVPGVYARMAGTRLAWTEGNRGAE